MAGVSNWKHLWDENQKCLQGVCSGCAGRWFLQWQSCWGPAQSTSLRISVVPTVQLVSVFCFSSLFLAVSIHLSFACPWQGQTEVSPLCSILKGWESWSVTQLCSSKGNPFQMWCSFLVLSNGGGGAPRQMELFFQLICVVTLTLFCHYVAEVC